MILAMDNFNQCADDRIPDFLSKSVKKKTQLSIYDFTFNEKRKYQTKKTESKQTITPAVFHSKQLIQNVSPSPQRYSNLEQYTSLRTEQQINNEEVEVDEKIISPKKYRSEQKLPILNQFNIQLTTDFNNDQKFIRMKKQVPKLSKKHGHYRQLSEKNQVVRIKDEQIKLSSPKPEQNNDPHVAAQDKCYFIRNLILNASSVAQAESRQKAGIYMLVSKLKETQRKGRMSINMIERKFQHAAPVELRTSKFQCQQVTRNNLKEQIMRKFTKQIRESKKLVPKGKQTEGSENKQQLVSAWNIRQEQEQIQQF